jgi:lipopolysaccharide heptosyltransferase II
MKNTILKFLCHSYRRACKGHAFEPQRPRFLLVSTTGLGDTLWGTPSLKALKTTFPHAYIAVVTSPIGKEILIHNPYIDDLFVLKSASLFSFFKLFFAVRRKEIQCALIFHSSQRFVLPFCILIGATEVIGTEKMHKGLDSLLTEIVPAKPMHEIERRLHIVAKVGAHVQSTPVLELHLSEKDEDVAQSFLKAKQIPDYLPIIGMHPGAKDVFKRWPLEMFADLGKRLCAHFGCTLIITGTATEKEVVEKISSQIPQSIPLTGELLLRPLAALIKKMSLFISNDTGPMHVAFAMQTPTIGLFAPTDFRVCGPFLNPKAAIIQKSMTCSPCLRKKCKDPFCMLQISVDEVFEHVLQLFYDRIEKA